MTDIGERLDLIEAKIAALAKSLNAEPSLQIDHVAVMELATTEPQKSEAETLVDIANSLPQEVFGDRLIRARAFDCVPGSHILIYNSDNERYQTKSVRLFHDRLLGVMSEYVGTEVGAKVARCAGSERGRVGWCAGKSCEWITVEHHPLEWLIAHRDCCLAIAERSAKP